MQLVWTERSQARREMPAALTAMVVSLPEMVEAKVPLAAAE
jgi:hypothetical protein